jgi:poly(A) polymerase
MKIPHQDPECQASLEVVRRLEEAGFEAYWVGGSVRDLLLKKTPKDFDVVTSARVPQISKLFPKHLKIGKKFGIVIATEFTKPVEIATFRKDLEYADGRRPQGVVPASLEEDVLRRDFTVNGLLFDPVSKRLIDLVGGKKDLVKRVIRTIGDPEKRFREDHLRLLRAIRFSVQLDFKIQDKTWKAIQKLAPKIRRISAERIREELLKILSSPMPDEGLCLLEKSGLLKAILPEVQKLKGVTQSKKYHPEGDVFRHTAIVLKSLVPFKPEPALLMAGLLHDIEKPSTWFKDERGIHFYGHEIKGIQTAHKILKRLRFSNEDQKKVAYLIQNHLKWFSARDMRLTRLKNYMRHPYFYLTLPLFKSDLGNNRQAIETYRYIMAQYDLFKSEKVISHNLLRGKDLIELGYNEGPIIGKILKAIEEKRLEETIKTREEALEWVKKNYSL